MDRAARLTHCVNPGSPHAHTLPGLPVHPPPSGMQLERNQLDQEAHWLEGEVIRQDEEAQVGGEVAWAVVGTARETAWTCEGTGMLEQGRSRPKCA